MWNEFTNRGKTDKTGQHPQEHNLHFYEQELSALQSIFFTLTSVYKMLWNSLVRGKQSHWCPRSMS